MGMSTSQNPVLWVLVPLGLAQAHAPCPAPARVRPKGGGGRLPRGGGAVVSKMGAVYPEAVTAPVEGIVHCLTQRGTWGY